MKNKGLCTGAVIAVLCGYSPASSQPQYWPSAEDLVGEWRFQEQLEGNVTGWPVHCEVRGILQLTASNGALVGHMRTEGMRCRNPNRTYREPPSTSEFAVQYTAPALSFFLVDGCPYTATVDAANSGFRGTLECTIEDEGEPMRVYGQWQATREGPRPQRARERPTTQQTPHLCGTSGRFAVFAFRPLGSSPVMLVPRPAGNHQIAHEQLFFCDNGVVIENIGFGTLDSLRSGSGAVIVENAAAFSRYQVVDRTRYDYDTMSRVVGLRICLPMPGAYDYLDNNCQHWADEQRRQYQNALDNQRPRVIRRRSESAPRPDAPPERRVIRRRNESRPR